MICRQIDADKGFIAYYENEERKVLYITLIAVRQDLKHQGIGGNLLCSLEHEYRSTEYKGIELEVSKTNSNACSFYLKHGFRILEDRNNKLLMGKDM